MRVLAITGDKSFGPGHARYELQRAAVDELGVVYMGRGSVWPRIPAGEWDAVTAQDPFWRGLFGWHAARRLGARFNVQVHTDLRAYSGVRHVLAQIVLRHADSVRVVSETIKQQVLHRAPRAKVTVLPVFVDIDRFASVVRMPHSRKTVLWVGRFEEEKDPLYAINVIRNVPHAELVMLGEGSLRSAVEQAAQLAGNVRVVGWQNPMHYLDTADVVLCTSRHESFGASIVEALAAGVPVVAPDVGVAREAGACVVPREQLAHEVTKVLQSGTTGTLTMQLLNRHQWQHAWLASLQ